MQPLPSLPFTAMTIVFIVQTEYFEVKSEPFGFTETLDTEADRNVTLHLAYPHENNNQSTGKNDQPLNQSGTATEPSTFVQKNDFSNDGDDKPEENTMQKKYIQNDRHYDRCSANLYSCRGRCHSEPRLACSCHESCLVYGNCCEDFEDACSSSNHHSGNNSGYQRFSDNVQCIGNNFLISSCGNYFGDRVETVRELLGMTEAIIAERCASEDSNEPLLQAPVTDTISGLQFKNFFCAVCNGVSNLTFWTGLTHCKHDSKTNITSHADDSLVLRTHGEVENRTIIQTLKPEELLASVSCETFWRPMKGVPNPCLHQREVKSRPVKDRVPSGVAERTGVSYGKEVVITSEITGNQNWRQKLDSLHFQWRNVSEDYDGIFNASSLEEKCTTLNSFVEHPVDKDSRYKNKYCYMLDSNSTFANKLCEPSLKISDDEGVWYTLKYKEFNGIEYDVTSNGLPIEDWDVHSGIKEQFWDALVTDSSLSRCDGTRSLILEGQCRSKSFFLTLKSNFTFVRSSRIRGNFNNQVEKYTALLVDTFISKVSNRTACVLVSFSQNKVTGSSVRFQSSAEFQCVDIVVSDSDTFTVTPMTLTGGEEISDNVNHYIMFVSNTLKFAMEKEKAVTLPVTIELFPCIFPDNQLDPLVARVRGYCTSVKNVWRAVKKLDELIGGLSLEGIITIICCILSVVGLIIRLALQNVVPFYKSYPGKIQFGLCLSLFLAYTLFMLGGLMREGSRTCMVMAVLTHVAFLSALFWMNVTAFEIWRTFRTWRNQVVSRGNASLILSVFYAVGIPILLSITALLVEEFLPYSEFSPSYGEHNCWLNGPVAVAIYFVVPCCMICCVNAIFVGLTLRSLRRQRTSISEFKKSNAIKAVTDTAIVIKIILLVGITWLLGLVAALVDREWLWIIFTIINASLGFMISVVLVFNKRVYYAVQAKCLCYNSESITVVSTQVPRH